MFWESKGKSKERKTTGTQPRLFDTAFALSYFNLRNNL
jgi:hypothetical protein